MYANVLNAHVNCSCQSFCLRLDGKPVGLEEGEQGMEVGAACLAESPLGRMVVDK